MKLRRLDLRLPSPRSARSPASLRTRWARLGLAGVAFFLVKGLLWLIVAGAVWIGS